MIGAHVGRDRCVIHFTVTTNCFYNLLMRAPGRRITIPDFIVLYKTRPFIKLSLCHRNNPKDQQDKKGKSGNRNAHGEIIWEQDKMETGHEGNTSKNNFLQILIKFHAKRTKVAQKTQRERVFLAVTQRRREDRGSGIFTQRG